jgi:hypothetical protein
MLLDKTHGFGEVAIVRYHYSGIEPVQPSVIEQVDCQVYVRAFLFGFYDVLKAFASRRIDEWCLYFMAREMPVEDFKLRDVALNGSDISFLAYRFVRIVRGC